MRNRTEPGKRPSNAGGVQKLLVLPGIKEAIALVREHAYVLAEDQTIAAAAKGEFGDKLRQLLDKDPLRAIDRLLEHDVSGSYLAAAEDEVLEDLAAEAGPKIAELWGLSESAGEELAFFMGFDVFIRRTFALVVNSQKPEVIQKLREGSPRFSGTHATVGLPGSMIDGHIYLDVTDVSYRSLTSAYKAVLLCRQLLGLQKQDLREGARPAIDAQRALQCAHLLKMGASPKEAARQLGFRVYTGSNPSGCYPLFRKYAEHGHEIEQKLDLLEAFLDGCTI